MEEENTPPWVFFTFKNCTNATKSRNASHLFIHLNVGLFITRRFLSNYKL